MLKRLKTFLKKDKTESSKSSRGYGARIQDSLTPTAICDGGSVDGGPVEVAKDALYVYGEEKLTDGLSSCCGHYDEWVRLKEYYATNHCDHSQLEEDNISANSKSILDDDEANTQNLLSAIPGESLTQGVGDALNQDLHEYGTPSLDPTLEQTEQCSETLSLSSLDLDSDANSLNGSLETFPLTSSPLAGLTKGGHLNGPCSIENTSNDDDIRRIENRKLEDIDKDTSSTGNAIESLEDFDRDTSSTGNATESLEDFYSFETSSTGNAIESLEDFDRDTSSTRNATESLEDFDRDTSSTGNAIESLEDFNRDTSSTRNTTVSSEDFDRDTSSTGNAIESLEVFDTDASSAGKVLKILYVDKETSSTGNAIEILEDFDTDASSTWNIMEILDFDTDASSTGNALQILEDVDKDTSSTGNAIESLEDFDRDASSTGKALQILDVDKETSLTGNAIEILEDFDTDASSTGNVIEILDFDTDASSTGNALPILEDVDKDTSSSGNAIESLEDFDKDMLSIGNAPQIIDVERETSSTGNARQILDDDNEASSTGNALQILEDGNKDTSSTGNTLNILMENLYETSIKSKPDDISTLPNRALIAKGNYIATTETRTSFLSLNEWNISLRRGTDVFQNGFSSQQHNPWMELFAQKAFTSTDMFLGEQQLMFNVLNPFYLNSDLTCQGLNEITTMLNLPWQCSSYPKVEKDIETDKCFVLADKTNILFHRDKISFKSLITNTAAGLELSGKNSKAEVQNPYLELNLSTMSCDETTLLHAYDPILKQKDLKLLELHPKTPSTKCDLPNISASKRRKKKRRKRKLNDVACNKNAQKNEQHGILETNAKPKNAYPVNLQQDLKPKHMSTSSDEENDISMTMFTSAYQQRSEDITDVSSHKRAGISSPKNRSTSCHIENSDCEVSNDKSEDSFWEKKIDSLIGLEVEFHPHGTVTSSNALLESDLANLPCGMTCLYDQEGEMCTLSNERYIKTFIQEYSRFIYVDVKRKELSFTKVGCQVVWRGQTPIPLSVIADGSKVKFDAILMTDDKSFQAVVIWKDRKPKYVTEPSNKSYIWIESRTLICEELVTQDGTDSVCTHYDNEKIFAVILKDSVFVNGNPADLNDLRSYSISTAESICAKVSKLMMGKKGTDFRYVCSCVWSGVRPSKDLLPVAFKRGEIYRLAPNNNFVVDESPIRLYCDLICQPSDTGPNCELEFEFENSKVVLPMPLEKLHFGNYKVESLLPLLAPVKAHVIKNTCIKSQWLVLLVQFIENETCSSITSLHSSVSESEDITSEKDVCPVQKSEIPLEHRQTPGILPVEGTVGNPVLPSVKMKRKLAQAKAETVKGRSEHTKQTLPARKIYPYFLNGATGVLTYIRGDYGILEVRNKNIKGSGMALAAFHKSVAYVDQWPLYRDVLFSEQVEDMCSKTWHCTLKRCKMVIQELNVVYTATLAWQGHKPTENDREYFKKWPVHSNLFYYSSFKIDGDLENLVFFNEDYNEHIPQDISHQISADIKRCKDMNFDLSSEATQYLPDEYEEFPFDDADMFPTLLADDGMETVEVISLNVSSEVTECLPDEYEEFPFDDADMFPTLLADDGRETVEVCDDATVPKTTAVQPKNEFDFGLSDLFRTSAAATIDAIQLMDPSDLFSPRLVNELGLMR